MSEPGAITALRQAWERGEPETFRRLIQELDGAAVDETVIGYVDRYLGHFHRNRRRVATVDPARQPKDNELVVQFGNYPPSFEALALNNPIRRNILDFWNLDWGFSEVESSPSWRFVDRVFVINRDDRPDRLYSVLRELARAGVPLDRISRHPASVYRDAGDSHVNGQIGCLTSHLEVCRNAAAQGLQNILIVEDDFGFIDDVEHVRSAVDRFFERPYPYDVCLLATSKHGPSRPWTIWSASRASAAPTPARILPRVPASQS
jgi:hypothetical protein